MKGRFARLRGNIPDAVEPDPDLTPQEPETSCWVEGRSHELKVDDRFIWKHGSSEEAPDPDEPICTVTSVDRNGGRIWFSDAGRENASDGHTDDWQSLWIQVNGPL